MKIDFFIIAILLILSYGVFKKENHSYISALSLETTKSAKGFLCILLVLFHLPNSLDGKYVLYIINDTGYLIVGCFLFLSGYGLFSKYVIEESTILNAKNYSIWGGVFRLLIPWVLATILYAIVYCSAISVDFFLEKISKVENGFLLLSHSWYVIVQIGFYVLFKIALVIEKIFNHSTKNKPNVILITSFVLNILYIFLVSVLPLGSWWYYSCSAFPIGMLLRYCESKIGHKKKYMIIAGVCAGIAFVTAYAIRFINSVTTNNYILAMFSRLLASGTLPFFLGVIAHFLRMDSMILKFLGKYSYDIFLTHMLFIEVLSYYSSPILSDVLYVALILALSILSGFLGRFFSQKIINSFRQKVKNV